MGWMKLRRVSKVIEEVAMQVVEKAKACRVLIVEDHEDTLTVMNRLLSRCGYETAMATTVAEAMAECERGMPDVVLSDLELPDGSGLDLVRELRSRGEVRCVALTGHGQPQHVAATRGAGFDAHLTKPVSIERLDSVLRGVCEDGENEGGVL